MRNTGLHASSQFCFIGGWDGGSGSWAPDRTAEGNDAGQRREENTNKRENRFNFQFKFYSKYLVKMEYICDFQFSGVLCKYVCC